LTQLQGPKGGPTHWLAPRSTGTVLAHVPLDYRYLEEVVRVGFPVHEARSYLNRHTGNPVTYRLVEARRGERIGHVRAAEVIPAVGGCRVLVTAVHTLPDGSPASYFAPDELTETRAHVEVDGGGQIPAMRSKDQMILHVPVRSYLRFLPGIYQGGAPAPRPDPARLAEHSTLPWGTAEEESSAVPAGEGVDQFRRFLLLFQHLMTTVTDRIDKIPDLTNPGTADPRFLPWIASWVNFELDGSLPLHQQRELVRRSIRLHRTRGTRAGMEDLVRVLTSAPVRIEERVMPQPAVLGAMTLAGGRSVEERYVRSEPPAFYLLPPGRAQTSFFCLVFEDMAAFRARFGERAQSVLRRIAQITTLEKPSHISFTIRFDEQV